MEMQKLSKDQEVPAGSHWFAVMGIEGDTKYIWDPTKEVEVEVAKATFESFRKKGYLAFKVPTANGDKGEQALEFDATAERYIFSPAMQGG